MVRSQSVDGSFGRVPLPIPLEARLAAVYGP